MNQEKSSTTCTADDSTTRALLLNLLAASVTACTCIWEGMLGKVTPHIIEFTPVEQDQRLLLMLASGIKRLEARSETTTATTS